MFPEPITAARTVHTITKISIADETQMDTTPSVRGAFPSFRQIESRLIQ